MIEERIERLEKELESLKARYELLHGAVSKEIKGCEHEYDKSCFCNDCYCRSYVENNPTPPCDHDWSETQWSTPNPNSTQWQRCMKCGVRKIVNASQSEKPTQTLADLISKFMNARTFLMLSSAEDLAKIAEDHFKTLLQSEYQRGYEHGLHSMKVEIKNRFDLNVGVFSPTSISELRKALFTESK